MIGNRMTPPIHAPAPSTHTHTHTPSPTHTHTRQFVAGKVERGDAHVKKQSEREYDMQEERKAMLAKLNLDDFEIKPIPRPKDDGDELF